MQAIWNQISNIGIHDELTFITKSRIKITNRVVIIISIIAVLYSILDFFFWPDHESEEQLYWVYAVNIGLSLLFIPVLILNNARKYSIARYIIIGFTSSIFLFNSLSTGLPFRTELYFFTAASFVFVMFTNPKIVITLFILQVVGYLIAAENIIAVHPELGQLNAGLVMRIIFAFSFLFFILYFMQQATNRYQEEIEIKNSQLSIDHDEMEKLNYTKDKIFSIISHDLRSPIASLQSLLVLLNNEHISANDFKKATDGLEKQVTQLRSSLDELLTWAKAQLHGINPAPEMIKIRELISQIITVSKVAARNKKIIITTSIESNLQAICDPNMFQSIMTNLISNAIKFTPVGGAVSISAERIDSKVKIEVEDTGIGIPAENIPKILNPTDLFTTRGTSNEKGTGLGLGMCSEFVSKNNGTFEIVSEDGKGSRFIVWLPAESKS